ncbi:hypothetical protein T265_08411 [Opisthorchis viverrini]|uniref:Uncharacterized protein n=1 Tax=Opisthorchis viverrini TaxID=6198 RepID=A0A074ZKA3_OPIVI|nr:hypothetical protein T265_08411 [Opisthorchis viverrini]KER23790.1 hypothetical protein T265_08411 [Opisthorchis viverrini]
MKTNRRSHKREKTQEGGSGPAAIRDHDHLTKQLIKQETIICGACGNADTTHGHPIIGSSYVAGEYPYGTHNIKDSGAWFSYRNLQKWIVHYGIQQMLAEDGTRTSIIGSSYVTGEYPYGTHNIKDSGAWFSYRNLQKWIVHYGIQQMLAEDGSVRI